MLLLGLLVGLEFLESGMFVFAASHITGGVDAGPREFAWVQASYAIGSMLMVVLQQALSRRFGYRFYLCGALALFLAGALACAASDDFVWLAAARFVLGFGGGAFFTSARTLVPALFEAAERPRAVRRFILGVFGASALAPILSASLIEGPGWRWIFIAIAPIAAALLVASWWLLPDHVGRDARPASWSAVSLLLAAVSVTAVQLALSEARYDLFDHPLHLMLMAGLGGVLLVGFLAHQWSHASPLLHVRHLRHPTLATGLVLYFLYYLLSNSAGYLFPIYAERGLGLPTMTVGWLNTFAGAVGIAAAYAYFNRGARLSGGKPFIVAGALSASIAFWLFSALPPGIPAHSLLLPLAAKGLFGVLVVVPVASGTFRELGAEHFAQAYQVKNFLRQIALSTATGVTAISLQDSEFANAARLGDRLQVDRIAVGDWLTRVQGAYAAQGLPDIQAHAAAIASVQRQVDVQSLLLSSADLYRVLVVLTLAMGLIALVQKRVR